MSYKVKNKEVWEQLTSHLKPTQRDWLDRLILAHTKGNWKTPIWLSTKCKVQVSKGCVYINRHMFNCHPSAVTKILLKLERLNMITRILISKSKKHGGILIYIHNFDAITSNMAIEHFIPETDINAILKVEKLEGNYDSGIKFSDKVSACSENRLRPNWVSVPPSSLTQLGQSSTSYDLSEKDISDCKWGTCEDLTPSDNIDQLKIRLTNSKNNKNGTLDSRDLEKVEEIDFNMILEKIDFTQELAVKSEAVPHGMFGNFVSEFLKTREERL